MIDHFRFYSRKKSLTAFHDFLPIYKCGNYPELLNIRYNNKIGRISLAQPPDVQLVMFDRIDTSNTERIEEITAEVEVGKVYEGLVARIVEFGAFITVLPGTDGLLHISQIAKERVENVSDFLEEGQLVSVKVLDVDGRGRIKLSMKALQEEAEAAAAAAPVAEVEQPSE